jgi:hypothetical protein
MDDPGLDPALRQAALDGIERISHWMGQRRPLLKAILSILGPPGQGRLKLIEVGAGNGHLSRWIAAELALRHYDAEVRPSDLEPSPGVDRLDCLSEDLPEADLYFSNLLLHHLGDWQVCVMLRSQAKASRLGFVHFDLQRSWLHWQLARLRTRLAGLHPINLMDALLSIQQGFTRPELEGLGRSAGLDLRVHWSFPFRWLVSLRK